MKRLNTAYWNAALPREDLVAQVYMCIEETLGFVPAETSDYVLRRVIDLLIARRDGVPHIMIDSNLKE